MAVLGVKAASAASIARDSSDHSFVLTVEQKPAFFHRNPLLNIFRRKRDS
jgi:hypothetical protein